MNRKLTVNKEVLAALTADELADLFAGTHPQTLTGCQICTFYPPTRRCA